jgi:hypothetical protein
MEKDERGGSKPIGFLGDPVEALKHTRTTRADEFDPATGFEFPYGEAKTSKSATR